MKQIAYLIDGVICNIEDNTILQNTRNEVSELCSAFPIYEEILTNEMS